MSSPKQVSTVSDEQLIKRRYQLDGLDVVDRCHPESIECRPSLKINGEGPDAQQRLTYTISDSSERKVYYSLDYYSINDGQNDFYSENIIVQRSDIGGHYFIKGNGGVANFEQIQRTILRIANWDSNHPLINAKPLLDEMKKVAPNWCEQNNWTTVRLVRILESTINKSLPEIIGTVLDRNYVRTNNTELPHIITSSIFGDGVPAPEQLGQTIDVIEQLVDHDEYSRQISHLLEHIFTVREQERDSKYQAKKTRTDLMFGLIKDYPDHLKVIGEKTNGLRIPLKGHVSTFQFNASTLSDGYQCLDDPSWAQVILNRNTGSTEAIYRQKIALLTAVLRRDEDAFSCAFDNKLLKNLYENNYNKRWRQWLAQQVINWDKSDGVLDGRASLFFSALSV